MSKVEQQQTDIESLIGNKYQILCRIGGGGMAQVLLARHRLHGGLFAVKILADHLAEDPRIVARFKQEATTAASLAGHPNIVSIFDIGEGNGLHYLVMQFVCGEDLGSYIRREGKLTPANAAGIIAQVAEALSWAQSKHVVHRDLKPANMLLDTTGRIQILDFGISKITDVADGLTRAGESLGTPFYMSPEQIRGERCDVRSDLYSLGVVFFELLSARRPFENESATAIQFAHLSTPPPLLGELDATIPPACDRIVQKLLKKDPAQRYQSPRELLAELYANGASSGPGVIRPLIDPGLQAEIDRSPETICPDVPQTNNSATTFFSDSDLAAAQRKPLSTQTETPLSLSKPSSRGEFAEAQGGIGARSRMVPVALVTAALLLAAIVAVVYFIRNKPRQEQVHEALAPTLEDAHGLMVLVRSGDFIFGDDASDSPHARQSLPLRAFYIDATEVPNAEYLRFSQSTGRAFLNESYATAHPNEPVTEITKKDAEAYAAWAGKRLPTEEEWEKAARGIHGHIFPWGDEPWVVDVPDHLQPVDSFPERKSVYGSYNMAGNAWEWTSTQFPAGERELADMRRALRNNNFSNTWFVIKGGSFSPNGSTFFRLYLRRGFPQDQHSPWIGLRCVKSPERH